MDARQVRMREDGGMAKLNASAEAIRADIETLREKGLL